MKKQIVSAMAGVLLMSTGALADECVTPTEPNVPERFETEDQLMATYEEVKAYVTHASPEFLACLEGQIEEINPDADNAAAQKAELERRHNENVDTQNAMNNRFKAAHTIWKEENPS